MKVNYDPAVSLRPLRVLGVRPSHARIVAINGLGRRREVRVGHSVRASERLEVTFLDGPLSVAVPNRGVTLYREGV